MTRTQAIVLATLVAGVLDLVSAFVFAAPGGIGPVRVLQFVASGPFGDVALRDRAYAGLGLVTHFAIMACMVAAFVTFAPRGQLRRRPIAIGLAYGLLLWIVMYWIVRPLRWPALGVPHRPTAIAQQLFSHLLLVGLPTALIARRARR